MNGLRLASIRLRPRIALVALSSILIAASPTAMAQPEAPSSAATADAAPAADERAQAMTLYEDCRWAEAYAVFAALADAGDARAAQVALLMARHGPRLYGREFPITPLQAATWAHQAIRAVVAKRER